MESLLLALMKDAQATKFGPLRLACQNAIDMLNNKEEVEKTPAYLLREKCLEPLHLALESRAKRLTNHAVAGIEKILKDERLQTSMETESEDKWLPIQILNTVYSTPNLSEEVQVDIMKLLLKMTFSTAWCMNARIITKVTQVYVDTYCHSSNAVRGVVQAALTQLLGSFAEKLHSAAQSGEHDADDVLSDFDAKGNSDYESLVEDIVTLLSFLTDKVVDARKAGHNKQAIPLLLEGIHAILVNSPIQLRDNPGFQELVWKSICPTLMSLLGLPKADSKSGLKGTGKDEMAPNLTHAAAKVIYNISVELAKKVGPVRSLRPVLESLFHRILMCPAPQNRLDALKAIRELLCSPEYLSGIIVTQRDNSDGQPGPTKHNDLALVKLIVDSVEECCHSNESSVCCISVAIVDDLLGSIEQLSKGIGLDETTSAVIIQKYKHKKEGKSRNVSERSESVTSDPGVIKALKDDKVPDNQDEKDQNNSKADIEEENLPEDGNEVVKEDPGKTRKDSGKRKTNVTDFSAEERQSALDFIEELSKILPTLLKLASVSEVDECLQKFSSDFSDKMSQKEQKTSDSQSGPLSAVLNADSIYSTSYSALCLNLQLGTSRFYQTGDKSTISTTEEGFSESILDTDMFLFLSPDWLAQVYKMVLSRDLLTEAGYTGDEEPVLIAVLKEVDSSSTFDTANVSYKDGVFDEEADGPEPENCNKTSMEAGRLLSKQILSTCWEGILDVLSVLLNGKSNCGITSSLAVMIRMEGAKEESMRARDAMCKSLDGLQKAAKLCCLLGLQQRCGAVFSQLANTSCVMEDFKHAQSLQVDKGAQKSPIVPISKPKLVRLHAAHVLSMDAMMTTALEIGSHSADCWKHVFRCCAFISELEHTYFSSGNNQSSLPRIHQEQAESAVTATNEDETELYGVPMTPIVPVAPRINVPNLIRQSSIESGWDRSISGGGVLNSTQASQALCGLSQEVDRLFEEAADRLTISALATFLSELCEASKYQLHKLTVKIEEEVDLPGEHQHLPVNSLHLYRLQNVLMKVAHSGRPLIHLLKIWSVVSSYLVEAAGHKDRSISKMAVTCVHDYIIAAMSCHAEMPHFHTNEMLCKTFENILCLELCDGDVQDQIVCSICELVEVSAAEIRSGWRPLFGALRAVRIEYTTIEEVNEARQRHVEAVLDVFDVYLNTDNILVFANATVDCILCLLKYVRGPGEFEDSDTSDTDSVNDYMMSAPESENLCIPALEYLKQCSIILQSMWKMPACPVFHGAQRIQVDSSVRSVDPHIPYMDFNKFSRYFIPSDSDSETDWEAVTGEPAEVSEEKGEQTAKLYVVDDERFLDGGSLTSVDSGIADSANKGESSKELQNVVKDTTLILDDLDNHTGILHVWFLMLEGLSGAISACPRSYQPQTMEMMFELLRSSSQVPGPKFGVYCMNHLLLPMLQSWLRSGSRKYGYWDVGATNFKQCCGHTSDLVVDMIQDFKDDPTLQPYLESVLQQLLTVLTECVAQPFEVISRLGCSCIRHLLLSAGNNFTDNMWQIIINGLQSSLEVTTYCTRQLMTLFRANSENFYGDIGQVKVATRKDCSPMEFIRMWHLAQQFLLNSSAIVNVVLASGSPDKLMVLVFLLDSQVSITPPTTDVDEDKSYVFLLYPPGYENSINPDHILARIPFRNIVVGLLSHQLLLQTIGCILLENQATTGTQSTTLPGMLSRLSTEHVMQLLDCLRSSYKLACDFDLRPGLKFLIQKVAHTEVAVNLYKQAGASMVFFIHTLIKICANIPSLTLESVRTLLSEDSEECETGSEVTTSVKKIDSSHKESSSVLDSADNKTVIDEPDTSTGDSSSILDSSDKSTEADVGVSETDSGATNNTESSNSKLLEDSVLLVADGGKDSGATSTTKSSNKIVDESAKGLKCQTAALTSKNLKTKSRIQKGKKGSPINFKLGTKVIENPGLFVSQLRSVCDELCQSYIDILYDKEGTSCVDNMADQQLFFLIAQPDEFPDIPKKPDLSGLSCKLAQTQARLQGMPATQPVSVQAVQDDNTTPVSPQSPEPKDQSILPPLSQEPVKSKREQRQEQESKVYNLATDKLIKNLMTEYKKRKNQNAMPSFMKISKKKKDGRKKQKKTFSDPMEQVIEEQQKSSIMKDSEAHLQSWSELLCTILGLFHQLSDSQFKLLLPTVFSCVNHLICHAQDMRLREELAQWLHRVGELFTLMADI